MTSYLYTTTGLVESELRATTRFSDQTAPSLSDIEGWITEISELINTISVRNYGLTPYGPEYIDWGTETLSAPIPSEFLLANAPVVGTITLEYNSANLGSTAAWTTRTADVDYVLDPDKGIILLTNNFSPRAGYRVMRVTYTAGYTTTPAQVQMLATKMVAYRVLATLIKQNVNERDDGGAISAGPVSVVEPASYGVRSMQKLKEDIDQLKDEVLNASGVYRYG